MKINIISKNKDLIGFVSTLVDAGHDVQAVNRIEPCDILVYDFEFKKDTKELTPSNEGSNNKDTPITKTIGEKVR